MKKLFLAEKKQKIYNCYSAGHIGTSPVCSNKEFFARKGDFDQVECLFSTWGMPVLDSRQIDAYLPSLKAVFYGAGSVVQFATPFLARGVRICSAWVANAIPVSEWVVAQIILANKGFYQLHSRYKQYGFEASKEYANTFPSNYNTKVGLLGFGMIAKRVVQLLKPYKLDIYVNSDYLSDAEVAAYGATQASKEYIFANCQTISNHLANKPHLAEVLNYKLFSTMKTNAVFLNTGRGAQVNEVDLIRAMQEEPNRTAVLDVTDPKEPLQLDDPLLQEENIIITPHRAGSMTKEVRRMGDYMIEEYQRFIHGEQLQYEVTLKMLKTMA